MSARRVERACVLGSSGFVGTWLMNALQEEGIATTTVDRVGPVGSGHVLADLLEADIGAILRELNPDAVFHLATTASVPRSVEEPVTDLRSNVETTVRLLEACRRHSAPPLVALASSAAVYGDSVVLPMDEKHPKAPVSPYGAAKVAAESYVQLYARHFGVPAMSFRSFSLYGPGQQKLVVYDLIRRTLDGEHPLQIAAPPNVKRDFVFVADAVRAMVSIVGRARAEGEAYNLATGRGISLSELAEAVQKACGVEPAATFSGALRRGDPHTWIGDNTAASELVATFATPLEVGLAQTVAWVRDGLPSDLHAVDGLGGPLT